MQEMVSTRTNPLSKLSDIFEVDPALTRKVNKKSYLHDQKTLYLFNASYQTASSKVLLKNSLGVNVLDSRLKCCRSSLNLDRR